MHRIIQSFSETKQWGKKLAILLVVLFVWQSVSFVLDFVNGNPFSLLGIFIPLLMFLLPSLALLKYIAHIEKAENDIDTLIQLESACKQQAKFFIYFTRALDIMLVCLIVGILLPIFSC